MWLRFALNSDAAVDRFNTNFAKIELNKTLNVGTPYDFDSIMHYQNTAFGKTDPSTNKLLQTIIPIVSRPPILAPNQKGVLSGNDTVMIKLTYNCSSITTAPPTTTRQSTTKVATFFLTMLNALTTLFMG